MGQLLLSSSAKRNAVLQSIPMHSISLLELLICTFAVSRRGNAGDVTREVAGVVNKLNKSQGLLTKYKRDEVPSDFATFCLYVESFREKII